MDYKLFLPETPNLENDDFVVYANSELTQFAKDMATSLLLKKKEILDYFGLDSFRKIQINLYDTHKDFIDFTSQFFKPFYSGSTGKFAMNMLNIYVSAENLTNEKKYYYRIATAKHEFIHIVIRKKCKKKEKISVLCGLTKNLQSIYQIKKII